jgi:hypothetical protein
MPESYQNHYTIYTEEQMTGFIEDGIMHETIREIISERNTSALCDLIIYTDTNYPDILDDAFGYLSPTDKLWFITNREVIKIMYPATYTNILSNVFAEWIQHHTQTTEEAVAPAEIITTMLGLFDPEAYDYQEVITNLLTYENMVELIDFLPEFEPHAIIQSGIEMDLFQLLELILLTKIELSTDASSKPPCLYTSEVQTYLDMLGNYVIKRPNGITSCGPTIIRAYDAMRQYLSASVNSYDKDIHLRIYIMFIDKFHENDREIFMQICQVIGNFPNVVKFTTEYCGLGLFLNCCQFDLADELISLLCKYDILPGNLNDNPTNYKILANIFYAATHPVHQLQIHNALNKAGYFTAFQEWFNQAKYYDLRVIDTCQWPLNVIIDDITLLPYPNLDLINLKLYDSNVLLMQFLTRNDLTNNDEVQAEQSMKIAHILKKNNITVRLTDTESQIVSEIKNHLLTTNSIFNNKLVRNKLIKLFAITKHKLITQNIYKYLKQYVFCKYIHQLTSDQSEIAQLRQLLKEYKPNYSIGYWEALIKSGLKDNSNEFAQVVELLKSTYFQSYQQPIQTSDLTGTQPPSEKCNTTPEIPQPNELINTLSFNPAISINNLAINCDPETLIGKFAIILKEFHTSESVRHCTILEQLSELQYKGNTFSSLISIILIYSIKSGFEFQLNDALYSKIQTALDLFATKQLSSEFSGNIIAMIYIITCKHGNIANSKKLICEFLNTIFSTNETLLIENKYELSLTHSQIIPEVSDYLKKYLVDTKFCLEINNDQVPKMIIRMNSQEYQKMQLSRWRNWCASRQISFGKLDHTQITDPDTQEFICPIAYEPMQMGDILIKLTGCGHKFSVPGIIEWCRTKNTCPMCRSELADGKLFGANCEMFELV